ncbi:unnamed protein product [Brassica rapa]|uniref:Uncharacterized protein n=1 Tax=Brassica campestris TaxID=3711 RepID=A0A8D9GXV9_BRACM|nr:unnamed protein product [Brassica rapa]
MSSKGFFNWFKVYGCFSFNQTYLHCWILCSFTTHQQYYLIWCLDHEDLFMSLPLHTTKINFHPDCREFGITVTLKSHQVEGVSSLIYKYLLSVNVLLVVLCPLSVTDGCVRDKRFTPEHEVLRYVGEKDCHRNFRKVMHDYVNKNSQGLSDEIFLID